MPAREEKRKVGERPVAAPRVAVVEAGIWSQTAGTVYYIVSECPPVASLL